MSFWGQFGLQEGGSVFGVEIVDLHDYAMFLLVMICGFIGYMFVTVLMSSFSGRKCVESQWLEVVWTVVPFFILLVLGLPSVKLLYLMDEIGFPEATVKVVGHQWYWSYEYSDVGESVHSYDSYMVGEFWGVDGYRLLEVDNRCVLAVLLQMRGLVTSDDVIHSWAVPSGCIKVDGVPGRVNEVSMLFSRPGVFYGQCSELCGVNHSFMPIGVEVVSVDVFSSWVVGDDGDVNNNNCESCDESGGDKSGWSLWGVLAKACYTLGKWLYNLGKFWVFWHWCLVYYGFYIPGKYIVLGGIGLAKWIFFSGLSLAGWFMWFVVSPVDALVYAGYYLAGVVVNGVWLAVTFPFKVMMWLMNVMWLFVTCFSCFCVLVFELIIGCLSSFGDDSFKSFLLTSVGCCAKEFVWDVTHDFSRRYK
uniref:Cytochrome c oxidase subunit 2 n=1 Tax=Chamberlainia hainesiana TaxID=1264661 RepID=A0A513X0B7_9BIVA|nr:cytochrome c oxidase subunit 2 [Chamberlainia hainesiana]